MGYLPACELYFWKVLKKVIFSLISLFLAFRSFELIAGLLATEPKEVGIAGEVLMAILMNVFITGMIAIPGFVFATHQLAGSSYYEVKNPALIHRMYNALHIEVFRRALMFVFWGRPNNRKKFFDGKASGIANFIYQSKQSEFGHILSFLLLSLASVLLLFYGYYVLFFVAMLINVIGNFYPAILQRVHRVRIRRLLQLQQMRNGNGGS